MPQFPLWRLLTERGLRWGEAVSFRWGDLDGEKCRLSVRPKIAKGKRACIVPLPRSLVDELLALRTAHYRTTGRVPETSSPIFLTPHGKHWSKGGAANARKALSRLLEAAEIPEKDESGRSIDVHALRGTAITRMLRHRVPVETVARIVGHRDIRVTLRHYEDLRINDTEAALANVPDIALTESDGPETGTTLGTGQ